MININFNNTKALEVCSNTLYTLENFKEMK